jgi:flavin reductase (DIM6/NTAB) family NADH-FMN oxidoreductase RutF
MKPVVILEETKGTFLKSRFGPSTMVFPQPVFLVGTDVDDKPNFLAVAWGGIACGTPPMVSVAIRQNRYSLIGIKKNLTFSVNITSRGLTVETDYCGIISGAKTDKVKDCGFDVFYGEIIGAPMIEQYPVNLECKVFKIIDLGSHDLVIGEIIETYVSDECLSYGKPDVNKIDPVAYITGQPGNYYTMGEDVGKAFRIGAKLKKNTLSSD